MAKFKLPEPLKAWKVISQLENVNGNAVYKVSKKEIDGSTTNAILTDISLSGESYNDDNVEYLLNESDFIQSIIEIGRVSNYIAVETDENERKGKFDLYIITEDAPTLEETLKNKKMSEKEVVDFGIQMSEILDKLEADKIFHGNIKPSNIYVTPGNRYKLGGFIDAESKVSDLSYVAPEIQRNEEADFTTDIYSTGLVMYAMQNGGKLPFEQDADDPKDAMIKRFEGETIPAPQNGSEKLKSVIVIACQPDSKNRWKNSGNLKNALNAIKAEIEEDEEAAANVIVPEATEFDGNVFEKGPSGKGDAAASAAIGTSEISAADNNSEADDSKDTAANTGEIEQSAEITPETPDTTGIDDGFVEPEIDNRVFDDYKLETKVFNLNNAIKSGEKDYGDYFEEPVVIEQHAEVKNNELEDYSIFGSEDDKPEKKKKSKKGFAAAIIIGIIVLLALLAAFGVLAWQKGLFGGLGNNSTNKQETTTAATEATVQETTAQPTTEQATTAPATQAPTEPAVKSLIRVVGEPYETAKAMLEAEGFNVVEGDYYYDDFYYEGNVISQYPEEYSNIEAGSTITLNISLGPEKKEESESSSDDDDSPSYSTFEYNSSYLSQDEVKDMSRSELNMALNEIYARRGRIFTNPELNAYFNSQSWYTPKYNEAEFASNVVFNDYEERNINLILNEQSERGYR